MRDALETLGLFARAMPSAVEAGQGIGHPPLEPASLPRSKIAELASAEDTHHRSVIGCCQVRGKRVHGKDDGRNRHSLGQLGDSARPDCDVQLPGPLGEAGSEGDRPLGLPRTDPYLDRKAAAGEIGGDLAPSVIPPILYLAELYGASTARMDLGPPPLSNRGSRSSRAAGAIPSPSRIQPCLAISWGTSE